MTPLWWEGGPQRLETNSAEGPQKAWAGTVNMEQNTSIIQTSATKLEFIYIPYPFSLFQLMLVS